MVPRVSSTKCCFFQFCANECLRGVQWCRVIILKNLRYLNVCVRAFGYLNCQEGPSINDVRTGGERGLAGKQGIVCVCSIL